MDIFRNLTKGKIRFITFPLAVIAGLIFLPISIGLGFAYLTNKKVSNKKLKFSLLSIIALITLFIGSAWVAAIFNPSTDKTDENNEQVTQTQDSSKEQTEATKKSQVSECISDNYSLAKSFKIVESKDNFYTPGSKTIAEHLQPNVQERTYRIVIPQDINLEGLKATIGKMLADLQKNEPDVDEVTISVYDREQDAFEAYTVGQFTWAFEGSLGKVSDEAAKANNRDGYKVTCKIMERIKQPEKAKAQKPTDKEFEIYDDLNGRYNALIDQGISDFDEDKIKAEVVKKYGITNEEMDRISIKVMVWHAGGDF